MPEPPDAVSAILEPYRALRMRQVRRWRGGDTRLAFGGRAGHCGICSVGGRERAWAAPARPAARPPPQRCGHGRAAVCGGVYRLGAPPHTCVPAAAACWARGRRVLVSFVGSGRRLKPVGPGGGVS